MNWHSDWHIRGGVWRTPIWRRTGSNLAVFGCQLPCQAVRVPVGALFDLGFCATGTTGTLFYKVNFFNIFPRD